MTTTPFEVGKAYPLKHGGVVRVTAITDNYVVGDQWVPNSQLWSGFKPCKGFYTHAGTLAHYSSGRNHDRLFPEELTEEQFLAEVAAICLADEYLT